MGGGAASAGATVRVPVGHGRRRCRATGKTHRLRQYDALGVPQPQDVRQHRAVHPGAGHGREALRGAEQVDILADEAGVERGIEFLLPAGA